MQMKMDGEFIYLRNPDNLQEVRIKAWGLMKWDRKNKWWWGRTSAELLNKLRSISPLTPDAEAERRRLNEVQKAVDTERTLPDVMLRPLTKYPVSKNLYAHQVRAANMALLVFGAADPKEVIGGDD